MLALEIWGGFGGLALVICDALPDEPEGDAMLALVFVILVGCWIAFGYADPVTFGIIP